MIQFKSVYLITALVALFLCAMSCGGTRQGCIKGHCTNGQGTFTFSDGAKYVGEFWNGTLNGQGTYTYADDRKYVGEWKNGKYSGQGTLTYPDGKKYVGGFWDGKRYGQGTLTLPDGSVQRGIWKNNELEELVQEEQNTSSYGNSEATQPVSVHGKKNEDSLVKTDEENIHRGKDLYKKLCKKCHDAYSTENIIGPGMQGILKKDMLPSSQKPATARNILNQLSNPFDKMPSFNFLSEEEKLSIIAFLNTL
jgi:hypothetical protein